MPGGIALLPGHRVAPRVQVPIPLGVSTLGSIIPVTAGQRALVGNVIWCGEFKRVDLPITQRYWRNSTGGNIGLPGEVTTTIGVDFAIAFGYPLVPGATLFVGRIWIDNGEGFALAYDAITNTVVAADSGINFTLYPGLPTQAPDDTIRAVHGEFTPGHNNLIYMVFTDFPTGAVKLPSIKVEFYGSNDVNDVFEAFTVLSGADQINNFASFYDPVSGEFFGWSDTDTANPVIHKFATEDMEEIEFRSFAVDPTSNGLNNEFALYDPEARIVFTTESPASNSIPLIMVDVDGGGIAARFGVHSVSTTTDETHLAYVTRGTLFRCTGPSGPSDTVRGLVTGGFLNNDFTLFQYGSGSITFKETADISAAGSGSIRTIAQIPVMAMDGFAEKLGQSGSGQQDGSVLVGLNNELWQYDYGVRDGNLEQIGATLLETYGSGHNVIGVIADVNNRKAVIITRNSGDSFGVAHVYGLTIAPAWNISFASHYHGLYPVLMELANTFGGASQSPLVLHAGDAGPFKEFQIPPPDTSGNRFENILRYSPLHGSKVAYQSGAVFTLMNYATGEADLRPITEAGGIQEYYFDARSNLAYITGNGLTLDAGRVRLDVPGPSGLTIGTVLDYTARLAGYDPAEIYVDPVLTDPVLGVIINRSWQTSALFGNLGQIYDFQYFESETKIKFVRTPKGEDAHTAEDLTIDEIAPIGEGETEEGENVITAIDEPENVPAGVSVGFIDPDKEYEPNVQQFLNNQAIAPTSNANILQLETPIVMTAGEAYERAARVALAAGELSVTQQFRLPWAYSVLEPSDLISITVNEFQYRVQITEITINGDFSLSCFGRNYSFRDDIEVPSDGNLGTIGQPLPGSSQSRPIVLDMPYLLGTDDLGQVPTIYAAVTSYGQFTWNGAVFWRGPVPGSYVPEFESDVAAVTGVVDGVLPTTELPFQTDTLTELHLILRTGVADLFQDAPSRAAFLAGVNAIVVGKPGRWELLYFRLALIEDDRNITLYGLLRGRRGTEVNCNNHLDRDDFVLVRSVADETVFQRFLLGYSAADIGATFKYRANEGGLEIQETFLANSLKPWAVVQLSAELMSGDDILLTWQRRTRIGSDHLDQMVEFPDPLPLGETSEAYELDIYSGATVVRTLTAITNSVTYTAAQQTADGFVPPLTSLSVKAYQMSATVGRGFEASGNLDVG